MKFAKVMFLHVSVIICPQDRGGWYPSMHCTRKGIPACLAAGRQSSQHALQVVSQHALQQGGSPGPHCRGMSPGPHPGGSQGPAPGGCTDADPRWTATAADGTHPTGMHSCLVLFWVNDIIRCRHRLCVDNMETITSTESFIFSSSNNNYTRKVNQRSVRGEKVCGNHSLDVWFFSFSSLLVVLIMLWIFKRYFS